MSLALATKPAPQIDQIATTFSLTPDPNDIHGPGLREQLLSSYIEWLEMEKRLVQSDLWPRQAKLGSELSIDCIPANTRWGDWHMSRNPSPKAGPYDFQHPMTRAAFVLWAVGAIDDIPDPVRDTLAVIDALELSCDQGKQLDEAEYARETARLYQALAGQAPTTMEGASAALRFIKRGMQEGETVADAPLMDAVIRFLERENPRPEAVKGERAGREDPAITAIDWWRHSFAKWDAFPDGTPDADPALDAASREEDARWDMMIKCVPTSIEGLLAWTGVLNEPRFRRRVDEAGDTETVLTTMARSAAYLAGSPAVQTMSAPSDAVIDPLLEVIADWDEATAGIAAFPAGECNDNHPLIKRQSVALERIREHCPSATTRAGALGALRLALSFEQDNDGDQDVLNLLGAALTFFGGDHTFPTTAAPTIASEAVE